MQKVSKCALPRGFLNIFPCLGHSVDLHRNGERQEARDTGLQDPHQVGEEETEDEDNLQSSDDFHHDSLTREEG